VSWKGLLRRCQTDRTEFATDHDETAAAFDENEKPIQQQVERV